MIFDVSQAGGGKYSMRMNWEARRSGWKKSDVDARSNADVDYGRIIHSASFRRLQGKTQILNLGDSDFYRTRLTHSLEVAQIAGSIARQLGQDNPGHGAVPHLPGLANYRSRCCLCYGTAHAAPSLW